MDGSTLTRHPGRRGAKAAPAFYRLDLDALYREYGPRIRGLALKRLGDRELAEDVVQETFLRVHRSFNSIDPDRPVWPWLCTIASRICLDLQRRSRRRPETVLDEVDVPSRSLKLAPTSDPEQEFEAAQRRDAMGQALRSLCQRQARVLMLREVEGWRCEDIAALEGISLDALKSLMARARRTFRAAYQSMAIDRGLHSFGGLVAFILGGFGRVRRDAERASGRIRAGGGSGPFAGLPMVSTTAIHLSQGLMALTLFLAAGVPAHESLAARNVSTMAHTDPMHAPMVDAGQERSYPGPAPELARPAPSKSFSELVALPDTNVDVRKPEQTMITSIAASPGFASDRTVFAVGGRADCVATCTNVLFVSRDAGSEWTRLPAVGLVGEQLLLPPAFGRGDDRIFTAGPAGLQLSSDGGQTFHYVGGPATHLAGGGSAAISPRFNDGEPVIVVGSQSPFEYQDPGVMAPSSYSTLVGPLDPTYAPDPRDGRILFGGLEVNAENTRSSVVYTCGGAMRCTKAKIAGTWLPKVRPAPNFADSGTVYAFTLYGLFVSVDDGLTFHPLKAGFKDAMLFDLAVTEHSLYLAVWKAGADGAGGVYRSDDGGVTWVVGSGDVFERGARTVTAAGGRLFAGRGRLGLACSTDGGRTWAPRC